LELEDNPYIKPNQFLKILVNWDDRRQKILIAGYPKDLNLKGKNRESLKDFEAIMFEDRKPIVAKM
jgi:hypothetical protein